MLYQTEARLGEKSYKKWVFDLDRVTVSTRASVIQSKKDVSLLKSDYVEEKNRELRDEWYNYHYPNKKYAYIPKYIIIEPQTLAWDSPRTYIKGYFTKPAFPTSTLVSNNFAGIIVTLSLLKANITNLSTVTYLV